MTAGASTNRSRRFVASVLISWVGVLVAIGLAYLTSKISAGLAVVFGVVSIFLIALGEFFLTYQPLLRYKERQLTTFFTNHLRMIENDIESVAAGDVTLRANIMRPTSDGWFEDPSFKIAYTHTEDEYEDEELTLEFESGQGCVGNVYREAEQKVAISPDHVEAWDSGWNTTEQHDRVTSHLNTIIGTPIYRPTDTDQSEPIAVLIVDSEQHFEDFVNLDEETSLSKIEFKETAVAERAVEHARDLGILL
ncbi:hypothetical protein [Halorussus ruber]|uniref:hypothetical protein n=1 Tax=Halorussus ruber TaxID=1126238 RepID=UPI001092D534|nr:hypothetical protein [Halorussus ruber]